MRWGAPESQRGQRSVRLVAVGVRQRCAPEVVGGHAGQRACAQHVGVHGHGRYVIVHEIAAQTVPIAHGHGNGHGRVNGHRNFGPPVSGSGAPADDTAAAAAETVVVLMVLLILYRAVVVVMMIMRRPPHRATATTCTTVTTTMPPRER